jgi:RimJ/RimL family protein N-acetyltransferase
MDGTAGDSHTSATLDTPRLSLRVPGREDFEDMAAMWADPVVTRFIGPKPLSREESWARFLRYIGHWSLLGFGLWVVRERDSGRFVGEVGFGEFKRDLVGPPLGDAPENAWVLAAWAHGQGFATEAVTASLEWARRALPARRTACIIAPANAASLRLAHKCGYRELGPGLYRGEPVIVFERP